jgi:hypothetical protein
MAEDIRGVGEGMPPAERTLWVYGYEMVPPQPEQHMAAVRKLLDRENNEAKRTARAWTARLVTRQQATHVMIVSTSPELDLEVNRKLEAELRALGGDFVVTVPMPIRAESGET